MASNRISAHLVRYFISSQGSSVKDVAHILHVPETTVEDILDYDAQLTKEQVEDLVKKSEMSFIKFTLAAIPEKDLPGKLKNLKEMHEEICQSQSKKEKKTK